FEDPERGDYRLQRHAASSFGGDVLGRVRPASDWTITAGAGLRGDILTQREDRAGRDGEAREQRRGLAGTQLLGNARGSLSYRPTRAVQLSAGARVDALGVRAEDELDRSQARSPVLWNVAPRARASFRVVRPLRLIAAYGRGFRPPEARA